MNIGTMTIVEIKAALQSRQLSIMDIVSFYLGMIEKENSDLNAYLSVFGDKAMQEAGAADARLAAGHDARPLEGVPVALKDNILVAGERCTAGSRILENYIASYDATVVTRLKEAGAIILGKTNLDEFAMGSSTENSAFGPTKNPRARAYVPGGSSGGSAAAVAGNLAMVAVGSDTGGSIRQPASFCGIVGMKPTYGRVSRSGLVALASSFDQIGPFAKTVEDAALVFSVISGKDKHDANTAANEKFDFSSAQIKQSIKGLKIGLPEEYFVEGLDTKVGEITERAAKLLEEAGATLHPVRMPHTKYALATYYLVMPAELSANLARFDGIRYGFSVANERDKAMWDIFFESRSKGFGDEARRRIILGTFALSSGYYDAYYRKAQLVRALIRKDFLDAFKKVDVLLTPTSPMLPFKFGDRTSDPLSMYLADLYTVSANLSGVPGLSLNAGFVGELPVGVQLMAPFNEEETLFRAAYALEKTLT